MAGRDQNATRLVFLFTALGDDLFTKQDTAGHSDCEVVVEEDKQN